MTEQRKTLTLKRKVVKTDIQTRIISSKRKKVIVPGESRPETCAKYVIEEKQEQQKSKQSKKTSKPAKLMPFDMALNLLFENWPKLFPPSPLEIKPLKVGIRQALFDDRETRRLGITRKKIRQALRSFTSSLPYLQALIEGQPRHNIMGDADGIVTAEDAASAMKKK